MSCMRGLLLFYNLQLWTLLLLADFVHIGVLSLGMAPGLMHADSQSRMT